MKKGVYFPDRLMENVNYCCHRAIFKNTRRKSCSIEPGTFPTKLKIPKVIPIFKAGDATSPSNYRPISLLSIFNKIFQKLICERLKSYLISKEIISVSRYGFREKHSTEHAILDIISNIQTLNLKVPK